jgi:cephalosporin-C deacetylase-like acetyl esterase
MKKTFYIKVIFVLIFSCLSFICYAKTVYLSSNGDDAKDGLTLETAVAHFSVAQSKAASDDIIQVSGMIDFSTDPGNTASPKTGIALAKSLIVQGTSSDTDGFDGNNLTRFIQANSANYTLTLKNLKLYRGAYTNATTVGGGGALYISGSVVNGENLIFDSNFTSGNTTNIGSAIMVNTTAGLTFKNCVFSNNTSMKSAAVYINDATAAGISLNFQGCAFISNTTTGTLGGSAIFFRTTKENINLSLINCTVAKNKVNAAVDGGTIYMYLGPASAQVNIVNCTVTENTTAGSVNHCAGVRIYTTQSNGTVQFAGKVNIKNSIIEGNYSTQTGTPYSDLSISTLAATSSTLMINNSLIGRNANVAVPAECFPGENMFNYLTLSSTASDLRAKLAPYDETSKTYPLLINSQAIDYGDAQYLKALNISTDQNGNPRLFIGNKCYAGASEVISKTKVNPIVTVTPVRTYMYNGSPQGPFEASNNGTSTSYTFSYEGTGTTTYGPSATLPTAAGTYIATATVETNTSFNSASSQPTAFTIFGQDPLKLFLTNIPTILEVISTIDSGTGATAITTKKFTFKSKNGVNTIYAIMAYPKAVGVYPAILMFHGGGGTADGLINNLQTYAALGYVTMALDEPGIASITNSSSYSTGPWKSVVSGEGPRFNVVGGVQNSTVYDAIIGSIEAFNLLSSQPNVDAEKMAVTGSSWGGYLTTFTSGILGNRVKAAYSTWGCGFYETASFWSGLIAAMPSHYKNDWLTYLDAGRRAKDITAPYFIDQATNDTYFWPEAVTATLNAISGTKNHVTMANLNHTTLPSSGAMKQLYMNYYLKGIGSPFGTINITSSEILSDGSLKINMNVSLPIGVSISSAQVYYSVPTSTWQTRNWIELPATLVNGMNYQTILPASLVNQEVNYYANLIDTRQVQTSSAMYKTSINTALTTVKSSYPEISVFPNPSMDVFRLRTKENQQLNISVYNLSGELLINKFSEGMSHVVDLNDYGDGVYILKVRTNDHNFSYKLIKGQ